MSSTPPPEYNELVSSARSLIERVYTLENGGKPWAFLKVNCRPLGGATSIPSFSQGEPISGSVELHLEKVDRIQAVTIEARGESLSVGREPIPFLIQETTLWSASMTDNIDPGNPKLKGDYVWPFYITLPETVTASAVAKAPGSEYPIPPSFSERASPAYVDYKLVVVFRRGKFRVDNVLSTSFAFLPRSPTPAPSSLRQLAYADGSIPPGPTGDPEGWEALETKSVSGTVFESRRVEMLCSFSLAKPLCYTRGTFIPFFLTLGCSDDLALDIFAARGSLAIRLMRELNIGADATNASKPKRSNNSFMTCVGQGVTWFTRENDPESDMRSMEGEISLREDLKPSSIFPRLCLKYYVTFEITAPGFTPLSENSGQPIFTREIVISTEIAPGPYPRSRVPPALESQVARNNYDVSIGMLTAANQRFIHHKGLIG